MTKKRTVTCVSLMIGIFLAGTVPAYAIPGIRAVRNAMTANKAKDKLTENPDEQEPSAKQAPSEGSGYAADPSAQDEEDQPRQGPIRRLLGIGEE